MRNNGERLKGMAKEFVTRFYGVDEKNLGDGWFFDKEYEYEGMRGCSYPASLVIYKSGEKVDEVVLHC